jgi:hypothetical protein
MVRQMLEALHPRKFFKIPKIGSLFQTLLTFFAYIFNLFEQAAKASWPTTKPKLKCEQAR